MSSTFKKTKSSKMNGAKSEAAATSTVTAAGSSITHIGEHSITHLLKVAKKNVLKKTEGSTVLDTAAEDRIPKFESSELTLGRVLGRGGFCVVSEITKIELDPKHDEHHQKEEQHNDGLRNNSSLHADEHYIHNIVQDRHFMHKHHIRSGKDCRYALKQLQEASFADAQVFVHGIVDLAVEARFLSVIRHPNIIKMRAMFDGTPYSTSFFVVLDKLYDIMTTRIVQWKKRHHQTGIKKLLFDRKGKRQIAFWVERITVAHDLASALKYLHDSRIVYRDLKPDNIGFDVRGDVKIFDFGLAKEINPSSKDENGLYQLTGDTGSPRYMAPEVALGKPYNESVDVYSFAILLWQICATETPFEGFNMKLLTKSVFKGNARPKCDPKWPKEITNLLQNAWSPNHKKRPDFAEICHVLQEEVNNNSDDEIGEILDASRKSEMSAHMAEHRK